MVFVLCRECGEMIAEDAFICSKYGPKQLKPGQQILND